MAELILNGAIVSDEWTLLRFPVKDEPVKKQAGKVVDLKLTGAVSASAEEIAALAIPEGKVIVPLAAWLARRAELLPRLERRELGVWIDSHEEPETLAESIEDINRIPVIAANFLKFTDGRGYSIAALLRSRYGYANELRAIGDVLQDQLFYMRRCGFNAFAVRADKSIEAALVGLDVFSTSYQAAVEPSQPLFRRHSRGLAA